MRDAACLLARNPCRRVAALMAVQQNLEEMGFEVRRESFSVFAAVLRHRPAGIVWLGVSFAGVLFLLPVPLTFLLVCTLLYLWGMIASRYGLRGNGCNLEAVWKGGNPRGEVVLVAHHDAAPVFSFTALMHLGRCLLTAAHLHRWAQRLRPTLPPGPFKQTGPFLIASVIFWTSLLTLPACLTPRLVPPLLLLLLLPLPCFLYSRVGANDNATGVAALLETAKLLRSSRPKNIRVRFLFSDAEELGQLGFRVWLEEHSNPECKRVVVAVDCVGEGQLALHLDGESEKHPELNLLARTLTQVCGKSPIRRPPYSHLRSTDAGAYRGGPRAALTAIDRDNAIHGHMDDGFCPADWKRWKDNVARTAKVLSEWLKALDHLWAPSTN